MKKFTPLLLVATLAFSTNGTAQRTRLKESFVRADSTFRLVGSISRFHSQPSPNGTAEVALDTARYPLKFGRTFTASKRRPYNNSLRCVVCKVPFALGDSFVYYVTRVNPIEAQYAHYICTTRKPRYRP